MSQFSSPQNRFWPNIWTLCCSQVIKVITITYEILPKNLASLQLFVFSCYLLFSPRTKFVFLTTVCFLLQFPTTCQPPTPFGRQGLTVYLVWNLWHRPEWPQTCKNWFSFARIKGMCHHIRVYFLFILQLIIFSHKSSLTHTILCSHSSLIIHADSFPLYSTIPHYVLKLFILHSYNKNMSQMKPGWG